MLNKILTLSLTAVLISIWPTSSAGQATPAGGEADPYDDQALAADSTIRRPAVIYSKDNAPATPRLEDLPLRESVSQYGITWTFARPARVGQFINGDWYVVGPATVAALDPRPLYGDEIPARQLDRMDRERPPAERVRNGFMRNPPARKPARPPTPYL